jgi:hypothetical protein
VGGAGGVVTITAECDRYLYNMMRIVSGTLVEVGLGRLEVADVASLLATEDRGALQDKGGPRVYKVGPPRRPRATPPHMLRPAGCGVPPACRLPAICLTPAPDLPPTPALLRPFPPLPSTPRHRPDRRRRREGSVSAGASTQAMTLSMTRPGLLRRQRKQCRQVSPVTGARQRPGQRQWQRVVAQPRQRRLMTAGTRSRTDFCAVQLGSFSEYLKYI